MFLFNPVRTYQGMRQPPLTGIPLLNIHYIWACCTDGTYYLLLPLLICSIGKTITHNCLYQTMHREHVCMRITREQGIGPQRLNGLIEQKGVSSHRGQVGTKMLCPLGDNLFRNGIGGQERTQSEEVSGSKIVLLHLREGEGPGGGYRFGMILNEPMMLGEQVCTMVLKETLVLREATSRFFDVGTGLIQSQRQPSQFLTDFFRTSLLCCFSLLKGRLSKKQTCTAQQEECPQLC